MESTASGQHGTRYLYGAVEIDYLDEGTDDDSDLISTDRQEIDWEAPEVESLQEWGADLTRKALRDWVGRKEQTAEKSVFEDEQLAQRIEKLDEPSRKRLIKAVRILGRSEADFERLLELASSLVAAFEYRHFHDVTSDIESLNDPSELTTLLEYLTDGKFSKAEPFLKSSKGASR